MPALNVGGKVKHFKYTPAGWKKFRAARRKKYISTTRAKIKKERQDAAARKAQRSRFIAATKRNLKGKMSLVKEAKQNTKTRQNRVVAATKKLTELERTGTKTEVKFARSRLKKFTNDFSQAKKKEQKTIDQYNKDRFKASAKLNKGKADFLSPLSRKAKENFTFSKPNLGISRRRNSAFAVGR
tara:strand:- start:2362 stop:2913 length:552 start_codon:yes stop_codon:yes gene_type:complete